MFKTLFLIFLIGWLSIVSFPQIAWAHSSPTDSLWLAQAKPTVQVNPSEKFNPKGPQETVTPQPESSAPDKPPVEQASPEASSPQKRSQSKPFNPYDMNALKQFDKGSHRAK